MAPTEPGAELNSQTDPPFAASMWRKVEEHLECARRQIFEEIRAYPTPIAACDAQFNHLLERRTSISQELGRLREAAGNDRGVSGSLEVLAEFVRSSRHLDEEIRRTIHASLAGCASERLTSSHGCPTEPRRGQASREEV